MRATLFIVFSLFAITACDAAPQYKNAAEFEAVVKSWELDGKSESEAISILTNNKFSCKERACYLELKGFSCNQKLKVLLDVNGKGDVVNAAIWKLQDGQLPTVCL